MQRYNIAGLVMKIIYDRPLALDKFKPFLYSGEQKTDITEKVNACKCISRPEGKTVFDEKFKWVKPLNANGNLSVYMCKRELDQIGYLLNVNNEWNNASIVFQEPDFEPEFVAGGPMAEILFRNRLLLNKGIVLHASAVEFEGKGIVFSAPSETGKTTQARLWCNKMGAKLINNDRPAIKIIEDKAYAFGTPWSGLVEECNNNYAPISAIVMLEQAAENSICKLNMEKSILKLMPRCFLPYYNSNLMNIAIDNIKDLLQRVPIYLLRCRPDMEAVELVRKTIWAGKC